MSDPIVSVIIPAYNAEAYLAETLIAVLAQSYPKIEIIVCDDASTDRTPEIAAQYADRGVTLFQLEKVGKALAANTGFQKSRGKYIKYLDADDLISADMVSLQVEAAERNPDHIVTSPWGRFYSDNPDSARFLEEDWWRSDNSVEWLYSLYSEGSRLAQCGTFLIPRTIIETAGGWHEDLSLIDDFEFFIRLILASQGVVFERTPRLFYRSGIPRSLSARRDQRSAQSAFDAIHLGTTALLEAENSDRMRRLAADLFQFWAYWFYPKFPELSKQAETRVSELGGSDEALQGGRTIRIVSKYLGWKAAIHFRRFIHALGYRHFVQRGF